MGVATAVAMLVHSSDDNKYCLPCKVQLWTLGPQLLSEDTGETLPEESTSVMLRSYQSQLSI